MIVEVCTDRTRKSSPRPTDTQFLCVLPLEQLPMDIPPTRTESRAALQEALGYLNFSSGAPDPRFQRVVNDLYGQTEEPGRTEPPRWRVLHQRMIAELQSLKGTTDAF